MEKLIQTSLKTLSVILWMASAFFILPCVFVANLLYPLWVEWGEEF